MTKAELRLHLIGRGWGDDGHGHLQKTNANGRRYRMKFGKLTARYEVKVKHANGSEWMRLRSGYYGKLSISANGKLIGFT